MSGEVVSWAMKQRTGSPAAKLILVKIADNAGEEGIGWPSIETMVLHTELGQSTVYKHLAALKKLGLLHEVDCQFEGYTLPGFQLHIPGWETVIPRRGKMKKAIPRDGKFSPAGGKFHSADGKNIPPGRMHIEEPSLEPPLEPSSEPSGLGLLVPEPVSEIDLAVEAYNEIAPRCPKWSKCVKLTDARRRAVSARLKEVGLEGWRAALRTAAASEHLGGPIPTSGSHQGWRVDIEFIATPRIFTKILEGGYAPGGAPALNSREAARQGLLEGIEEALR